MLGKVVKVAIQFKLNLENFDNISKLLTARLSRPLDSFLSDGEWYKLVTLLDPVIYIGKVEQGKKVHREIFIEFYCRNKRSYAPLLLNPDNGKFSFSFGLDNRYNSIECYDLVKIADFKTARKIHLEGDSLELLLKVIKKYERDSKGLSSVIGKWNLLDGYKIYAKSVVGQYRRYGTIRGEREFGEIHLAVRAAISGLIIEHTSQYLLTSDENSQASYLNEYFNWYCEQPNVHSEIELVNECFGYFFSEHWLNPLDGIDENFFYYYLSYMVKNFQSSAKLLGDLTKPSDMLKLRMKRYQNFLKRLNVTEEELTELIRRSEVLDSKVEPPAAYIELSREILGDRKLAYGKKLSHSVKPERVVELLGFNPESHRDLLIK